jgi:hypothetical protein
LLTAATRLSTRERINWLALPQGTLPPQALRYHCEPPAYGLGLLFFEVVGDGGRGAGGVSVQPGGTGRRSDGKRTEHHLFLFRARVAACASGGAGSS